MKHRRLTKLETKLLHALQSYTRETSEDVMNLRFEKQYIHNRKQKKHNPKKAA
jgi:hypothetical protein